MKYLLQFKIFGKVFRFTYPFDNIVEYQFGGISDTTVTKNGKTRTVRFDTTNYYRRIGLGFYVLEGNLKPKVKFITNQSTRQKI